MNPEFLAGSLENPLKFVFDEIGIHLNVTRCTDIEHHVGRLIDHQFHQCVDRENINRVSAIKKIVGTDVERSTFRQRSILRIGIDANRVQVFTEELAYEAFPDPAFPLQRDMNLVHYERTSLEKAFLKKYESVRKRLFSHPICG